MPRRRRMAVRHRVRHYFSRAFHRRKAKPSVALLAGLAVGPAAVVFGTGGYASPIWQYGGNKAQELWDRITIAYFGKKVSDGSSWSLQQGGWVGTVGIVVGALAHAVANWVGLNRALARMKLPFRI